LIKTKQNKFNLISMSAARVGCKCPPGYTKKKTDNGLGMCHLTKKAKKAASPKKSPKKTSPKNGSPKKPRKVPLIIKYPAERKCPKGYYRDETTDNFCHQYGESYWTSGKVEPVPASKSSPRRNGNKRARVHSPARAAPLALPILDEEMKVPERAKTKHTTRRKTSPKEKGEIEEALRLSLLPQAQLQVAKRRSPRLAKKYKARGRTRSRSKSRTPRRDVVSPVSRR